MAESDDVPCLAPEDSLENLGAGVDGGMMSSIFSEAAALAASAGEVGDAGAGALADGATRDEDIIEDAAADDEGDEGSDGTAGASSPDAGGSATDALTADATAHGEDTDGDAAGAGGDVQDQPAAVDTPLSEGDDGEALAADDLADGGGGQEGAEEEEQEAPAAVDTPLSEGEDGEALAADDLADGGGGQEGAEEEEQEAPKEEKQSFPSFLEAQLDDMLAKHTAKHPPPPLDDSPDDDAGVEDTSAEADAGENSHVQAHMGKAELKGASIETEPEAGHVGAQVVQSSPSDRIAKTDGELETAAVKIQALARGKKDRRQLAQLQAGNADEASADGQDGGPVAAASEQGDSNIPADATATDMGRAPSSDDDGARSSDEEGAEEEEGREAEEAVEHAAPVTSEAAYPPQKEETAVVKIQALTRGRRDRQRVQELKGKGKGSSQGTGVGSDDGLPETAGEESAGRDAAAVEENQKEEEDMPRLSFAKPITLKTSPERPAVQPASAAAGCSVPEDVEPDDPLPKLSFAAPIQNVRTDNEGLPAVVGGREEEAEGCEEECGGDVTGEEEKVTFAAAPPQSLDIWMAGCDGDDTMDATRDEEDADDAGEATHEQRASAGNAGGDGGEEEEEEEEEKASTAEALPRRAAHAGLAASSPPNSSPRCESRAVAYVAPSTRVQAADAGGAPMPALSRRAAVEDRIMTGLKEKLQAVEEKVQELQQQLLERLSGAGDICRPGFTFEDEEGEEEAVAALNARVEKLIRMRAQIMLAIEHQKTISSARPPRPPSGAPSGMASPRARLDARALLGDGESNPSSSPFSEHSVAPGGSSARGGSSSKALGSLPRHPAQENRVPPAMKLPSDLSLKPIRGTSRVPPAMFQRNRPPPAATHLYEKYPEEPRAPSREIAVRAPMAVRKTDKAGKAEAVSPRGPIDYDNYNNQIKEDDVHVSFQVLSEQRANKVATRSKGRAASVAAQEREMRLAKEQDVLRNLVRNQTHLETRYAGNKEADRAAKLQRINHGGAAARGGAGARHLFNGSAGF